MKPITDDQLNLMFNNFAKISQWLSKGKDAKYPLPFIFETIFNEIETLKNELAGAEDKLQFILSELKNQTKPIDNTSSQEAQTADSMLQTEETNGDNLQSAPETTFTMEEIETGTIDEDAFTELDKQLNNLLME